LTGVGVRAARIKRQPEPGASRVEICPGIQGTQMPTDTYRTHRYIHIDTNTDTRTHIYDAAMFVCTQTG
jgi:hypothetical protein